MANEMLDKLSEMVMERKNRREVYINAKHDVDKLKERLTMAQDFEEKMLNEYRRIDGQILSYIAQAQDEGGGKQK